MTSLTPEIHVLLERLEKLEREVAEMNKKRASGVLEANAFVLKDSEGRVRAVLQMQAAVPEARPEWEESKEPRAVLTLYDKCGHARAQLREGILMVGKGNDHCAKLVAFEQGGAQLALIEGPEQERSVAGLGATKDGPQILVEDPKGNKTVIGHLYAGALGYNEWKGLVGKPGSGVSSQDFSAASLVMIDQDMNEIWRAP